MEWYVKFGSLLFLCLIGLPYIVQKFTPPKADEKGYIENSKKHYGQIYPGIYGEIEPPMEKTTRERLQKQEKDRLTGSLIIRVDTEPQHPDVTIMRKRLRKKQEQAENLNKTEEK